MLTFPAIVERPPEAYVAIGRDVTMPFGDIIGPTLDEVAGWLGARGIKPGPAIFRYKRIDMPRLGLELGFITDVLLAGEGHIIAGLIPAGRYVTATHIGPYDELITATAAVIGWASEEEIAWNLVAGPDGEIFAARFEVYPNGPMDEPDPQKWETRIFIKMRD